jgi:Aerobic-type carbon monoxide dehydrogenase, large subunit CoxL/CutL homologs
LVGRSVPRSDLVDKVTGQHQYAIDLRLPGMRYATTRAAPVHGGKLIDVEPAPAIAIEGVEQVVRMADSAGVIARTPWSAMKAVAALQPKFEAERGTRVTTHDLYDAQLLALDSAKREEKLKVGDGRKALRSANHIVEAIYRAPFLHHAQMEPLNAVASWRDGRLDGLDRNAGSDRDARLPRRARRHFVRRRDIERLPSRWLVRTKSGSARERDAVPASSRAR